MCPGCQDGPQAPRSGERDLAGSPRLPQTNARHCWAAVGVQAEGSGARLGLYRFPWKFVLEEASWSGGGSRVGDCPRRWARYCYKHCSCLQSDSPGCCLEGAPLGQNGVALVWAGLLHGIPHGQCLSWGEQGLDQQVSLGMVEGRR